MMEVRCLDGSSLFSIWHHRSSGRYLSIRLFPYRALVWLYDYFWYDGPHTFVGLGPLFDVGWGWAGGK